MRIASIVFLSPLCCTAQPTARELDRSDLQAKAAPFGAALFAMRPPGGSRAGRFRQQRGSALSRVGVRAQRPGGHELPRQLPQSAVRGIEHRLDRITHIRGRHAVAGRQSRAVDQVRNERDLVGDVYRVPTQPLHSRLLF